MDYKTHRRHTAIVETTDFKDNYPHDIQIYDEPPMGEMSLEEFQELGFDRLKALRLVETTNFRSDLKTLEDRKKALCDSLKSDGLKYYANLLYADGSNPQSEEHSQIRMKDHLSHFILRLVYCHDPEQTKWFINQEVEFFKLRFSSLDKKGVEYLLSINNLDCTPISQDEKLNLKEELGSSSGKVMNIDITDIYKVRFEKVVDLVRGRKVYLKAGVAYITHMDMISVFVSYFRESLVAGLESAKSLYDNISDDERLTRYLKGLPSAFSGMARVVWSTTATPIDKLNDLSKSSYPMCMRTLHEALCNNNHLKNSGRMQYGLFLKGIGVTLEDALRFWSHAFSKKIDGSAFEKKYAYSIRHYYGKEGRQTNYTPYGCQKVISSAVGPGEYHGCPFRHMDRDSLCQKLTSYGVFASNTTEILDLAKDGQYHLACAKYFEIVHNKPASKPLLHPNAYFSESRAILTEDDNGNKDSDNKDRSTIGTPGGSSRRNDRYSTPSGNTDFADTPRRKDRYSTPSRNADETGTPLRKIQKTGYQTPSTRDVKMTPVNIAKILNDDDFAEFMDM
ncbi:PREDICTED: DNA primase large subunit-like [Dinoponera quadriceps]|uniref:DNA primase large subunit n=1 Tax=Dinoponera quadriceps TaxID=609295 RepID=A0A6P3Y1G9_DINQU|nr:PREDICTED: DNA primase large subunit-like [Dinoponera quadriceps]XP_014484672.1 PREDICTED: DNA primase large subunit-like [Dinoponera quadriceps]XP_014484674.1 PREDICTED: DNA primase large subunit-like [Dinoponera quadriceps]